MARGVNVAGVVDQHVEAAEAGEDLIEHQRRRRLWRRHRRVRQGIRSDGRGHFRCAHGGDIVDGDTRSFGGEAFGDGAADAVPAPVTITT
jgi:hypothetical protein